MCIMCKTQDMIDGFADRRHSGDPLLHEILSALHERLIALEVDQENRETDDMERMERG